MVQPQYFRFELFVKDLKESVHFYQEILGLEMLGQGETSATFHLNNTRLLLTHEQILHDEHYFDAASLQGRKGVGVELILHVEDIAAVYQKFFDLGYPIQDELVERSWGSTDFRIVDPDGYYFRITT